MNTLKKWLKALCDLFKRKAQPDPENTNGLDDIDALFGFTDKD